MQASEEAASPAAVLVIVPTRSQLGFRFVCACSMELAVHSPARTQIIQCYSPSMKIQDVRDILCLSIEPHDVR